MSRFGFRQPIHPTPPNSEIVCNAESVFARTGRSVMTIIRLTFLSHFVICLACLGLTFFAWVDGVPQTIWANDMSMMTSVIAALFVATADGSDGRRGKSAIRNPRLATAAMI